MNNLPTNLICFSHLRWDFVYQRPQHLLTRFAKTFNVYFVEEPIFDSDGDAYISFSKREEKLWVGVPHLPDGLDKAEINDLMEDLIDKFLKKEDLSKFIFWYYTPMAYAFTELFQPRLTVYDCMDELSQFKFAPPELKILERKLLQKADVVFTGGVSLYEAKKNTHENIHAFPSSIEREHFAKARKGNHEPADQKGIPNPKLGFYGVIDERFDIDLIEKIAVAKPEWQIVLLGPVVKIDPATLPKRDNIHYLGAKDYKELPAYLSGWDIALLPFLLNDATKYISPTKTPEYLAAGRPVVSTAITDVVNPYGKNNYVKIASDAAGFIKAIDYYLKTPKEKWLPKVDAFLVKNSWDITQEKMLELINTAIKNKETLAA
jgi:glycosyltransferase involved in cell wall biosynthesis